MGMFVVKAGAEAIAIRDGREWYPENMTEIKTKTTHVFWKEEMILDPTGIAKWACVPANDRTIGGAYAKAGYFGFRRDGWALLVRAANVLYQ